LENSALELLDGDILASYRPISKVIRIDRRTGEIVWKLGPPMLAGQHAPNPLPNARFATRGPPLTYTVSPVMKFA
jgi:hypothetical protein